MPYIKEQEYREMMFNFGLLPHLKEMNDMMRLKIKALEEENNEYCEILEEKKEIMKALEEENDEYCGMLEEKEEEINELLNDNESLIDIANNLKYTIKTRCPWGEQKKG